MNKQKNLHQSWHIAPRTNRIFSVDARLSTKKALIVCLSLAALVLVAAWSLDEPAEEPAPVEERPTARAEISVEEPVSADRRPAPPQPRLLAGPTLRGLEPAPLWPAERDPAKLIAFSKSYPLFATAKEYTTPLFQHNSKDQPVIIGYVRYASHVRVGQAEEANGCAGGTWHRTPGGAMVCTDEGFDISDGPLELATRYVPPDIGRFEPFLFAKAVKGTPRLARLPTEKEAEVLESGGADAINKLGIVQEWLNGAYFIAIDKLVEQHGRRYYRTAMGRYLRTDDVEPLEATDMHGELLDDETKLPLAFVYEKERPLYCLGDGAPGVCGRAAKHARFPVERSLVHGGKRYLAGPDGVAVLREHVRLAERIQRPDAIPADARWMHIDLGEQSLVAYEGDRPVLATLVSSGLDSHATPTGTWRIQRRYVTKTMRGPDPDHGVYEVAEVPWTLYYHGNYAIHGAYWHDVFGEQRSHGCTNIPPADARWLFRWVEPAMPRNWHTLFYRNDSWAHFTD